VVEGLADAFAALISRYSRFFRTRTRDSAAAAARYLSGLAQAGPNERTVLFCSISRQSRNIAV
jgi:hypothetical protein